MKLLVISSPGYFEGESAFVNALFDEGLEVFHLRKPGTDRKNYAAVLTGISSRYHDRVALHQHHDLSEDFGTNRLHFSEAQRKTGDGELLSRWGGNHILSTSVHELAELEALNGFDYAFMGPIFDSFSKLGYRGIAKEGFRLRLGPDAVPVPREMKVIALGGIGPETIGRMKRMGFDGAAMLGWIWNDRSKAVDNFKQVKCWISENT